MSMPANESIRVFVLLLGAVIAACQAEIPTDIEDEPTSSAGVDEHAESEDAKADSDEPPDVGRSHRDAVVFISMDRDFTNLVRDWQALDGRPLGALENGNRQRFREAFAWIQQELNVHRPAVVAWAVGFGSEYRGAATSALVQAFRESSAPVVVASHERPHPDIYADRLWGHTMLISDLMLVNGEAVQGDYGVPLQSFLFVDVPGLPLSLVTYRAWASQRQEAQSVRSELPDLVGCLVEQFGLEEGLPGIITHRTRAIRIAPRAAVERYSAADLFAWDVELDLEGAIVVVGLRDPLIRLPGGRTIQAGLAHGSAIDRFIENGPFCASLPARGN